MKKIKRKNLFIILVCIIICILLLQIKKQNINLFQEDLIFFKLFDSRAQKTDKFYPSYLFQVSYKNLNFQNINLSDSINPKTLIREKIAPRNKWYF